jgi:HTH-type transcriptional regulator / antitoxin HipB
MSKMPLATSIPLDRLPEAVRYHREQAGLTQNELAALAGVGKTAIFDIEKRKATVQLDTLMKVLSVLNIEPRFQSPLMAAFLGRVT